MKPNKSNVSRSLFFSFLRRYFVTTLQFVAVVWLARLLTPEQIGIYTVGAAIMGVANMVRDFGIGQYLVQEKQLSRERVANALGLTMLAAWLMGAAVFASAPALANYYSEPLIESVMQVTAINFFVVPFGSMTPPLLKRGMGFGGLFKLAIASTVTSTTVVLVLAHLGFGVMSLAWSSLAGSIVGAIGGQILLPRKFRVFPRLNNARPIMKFGSFILGSNFINQLGTSIPDLLIGKAAGFSVLGLFSRANGYLNIFNSLIGKAVFPVIHAHFAQLGRNEGDLPKAYLTSLDFLTAVGWFFLGLMAIYAKPVIYVLFGDQWLDAAPAAALLCCGGMIRILARINDQTLLATGKVDALLKASLIFNGFKILLVLAALEHGLTAIAGAVAISLLVHYAATTFLVGKLILDQRRQILKSMLRNLAIVVPSIFIPAILFSTLNVNLYSSELHTGLYIFGLGVSSAIIFLGLIYGAKHPLWEQVSIVLQQVRTRFGSGN